MDTEDTLDKFAPFPKLSRLFRDIVVTEKIDGTNAQVCVLDNPEPGSCAAAAASGVV